MRGQAKTVEGSLELDGGYTDAEPLIKQWRSNDYAAKDGQGHSEGISVRVPDPQLSGMTTTRDQHGGTLVYPGGAWWRLLLCEGWAFMQARNGVYAPEYYILMREQAHAALENHFAALERLNVRIERAQASGDLIQARKDRQAFEQIWGALDDDSRRQCEHRWNEAAKQKANQGRAALPRVRLRDDEEGSRS